MTDDYNVHSNEAEPQPLYEQVGIGAMTVRLDEHGHPVALKPIEQPLVPGDPNKTVSDISDVITPVMTIDVKKQHD